MNDTVFEYARYCTSVDLGIVLEATECLKQIDGGYVFSPTARDKKLLVAASKNKHLPVEEIKELLIETFEFNYRMILKDQYARRLAASDEGTKGIQLERREDGERS